MLKRIAVAVFLAAGLSGAASATTVTYLFSGVVTNSGGPLPAGSPYTATFLIELSTPGTPHPVVPSATEYVGAVVSASFSIGSGTGATGMNVIVFVIPGLGSEFHIDSGSLTGTDGSGNALTFVRFSLEDYDGTAFSSQVLQVPVDVSQFETADFFMTFAGGGRLEGSITSIQLVPEPSLLALLGAGVLTLALRRRIAA